LVSATGNAGVQVISSTGHAVGSVVSGTAGLLTGQPVHHKYQQHHTYKKHYN
jgi:hypothetical protein